MNAREKLNQHAIWMAMAAGVFFGAITSSWLVFVLVTGGLIASGILNSEIRLGSTKKGRRRKK